jgi:hypothetical protein
MSSQSDEKKVNPWKMVLGGVPLLLLILIGSAYALFAYAFPQGKVQYAAHYRAALAKLGPAGIPADRLALLREIEVLVGRKEATLPAVAMMVGVAADALRDGRVSDDELKHLVLVRDFSKSKSCAVSFGDLGGFLAVHPEIKSILERRDGAAIIKGIREHQGGGAMAPASPSANTTASLADH